MPRQCNNCGKPCKTAHSALCSDKCRREVMRRASDSRIGVREADTTARTLRILALDEQLWRASTPWEREGIKEQIRELQV